MSVITDELPRAPAAVSRFPPALLALFAVWASLILLNILQDIAGPVTGFRLGLFDVDVERGFYTWYSQLVLAGTAALLADTGVKIAERDRRNGTEWLILALIFLGLSADEFLALHEFVSERLSTALDTSGFLTFAWVIPAGLICVLGLIVATPFLLRLPGRVRLLMLTSAGVFLSGALGMEMIAGQILTLNGRDFSALSYRLAVLAEEGLEGLGVLIFLYSHLLYRRGHEMRERFTSLSWTA